MRKARGLGRMTREKRTAKLGSHQQEGQIKFVARPMDQRAMRSKVSASSDLLVQGSVTKHHNPIAALMAPGAAVQGTVMRLVLAVTGVSSQTHSVRCRSDDEVAVVSEGAAGRGTMMNMSLGRGRSAVIGTGVTGIGASGTAVIGIAMIESVANETEATGTEAIGIAATGTEVTGIGVTGIAVIGTEATETGKTGNAAETAPNGTGTETVIGATVIATGVTKIVVIATEVTGRRIGIAVTVIGTTRIVTAAIGTATRTEKKTVTEATETVIVGTGTVTGATRIVAKGVKEAAVEGTTGGVETGSEVRAAVTGLQNGCRPLLQRRLPRRMES